MKYWYYTAVIVTEQGEYEFSKTVEYMGTHFPIGIVICDICEVTTISPADLSFRLVVQINEEDYNYISKLMEAK